MVSGKRLTITGISQAADAVFTTSATIDTSANNGWAVGKRIYLSGIGGMTALNGRYFTITEVSGATFKVGVDTSAMSAYTSGGYVFERWDGLTIEANDFHRTQAAGVPANAEFKAPIWVFNIQKAFIKNNAATVKAGLSLNTFAVSDFGEIYVGPTTATTVVANAPSALLALQSTNMEIETAA